MSYTTICGIDLPNDFSSLQETKISNLIIAVFFDGTNNNKYNSDKGGKNDSSYVGSHTNVSQLWNGYEDALIIDKVYIEGIATHSPVPKTKDKDIRKKWDRGEIDIDDKQLESSNIGDDYYQGSGFGFGSNGINAKIERGCQLVNLKINKMAKSMGVKKTEVENVTVDVFGFSRGAAAARSFASRLKENAGSITEGRKVCLKEDYLKNTPSQDAEITVRFMGLFDTVSSFHNGLSISPDFTNDIIELALNIPNHVEKCVHLVAADEYRKNFALTTITSAEGRGIEIVLPGAHSDVGGGYASIEREPLCMNTIMRERSWRGYLNFDEMVNQRWISKNTLLKFMLKAEKINQKCSIRGTRSQTDAEWLLRSEDRIVRNNYAKIPLKVMSNYANEEGKIEFKKDIVKDWDDVVPDLLAIKKRIENLAKQKKGLYEISQGRIQPNNWDKEDYELVLNARAEYIHLSAHNNGFMNYIGGIHEATDDNRRIIIDG